MFFKMAADLYVLKMLVHDVYDFIKLLTNPEYLVISKRSH